MCFSWVIDALGRPLRSGLARLLSALLLCAGVQGSVVGSASAEPKFAAARSTDVASPPYSVALGDLNNDGKLDVAVVHLFYSSTVSVFLGNGGWHLSGGRRLHDRAHPQLRPDGGPQQ